MQDFSLKRDFKNIDWKTTIITNLVRAVSAGFVWTLILLFSGSFKHDPLMGALSTLAALPIGYLFILMPVGIVVSYLASVIPFIGLFNFLPLVTILPGDPLVYIIKQFVPQIVPVEEFGFVNFRLIIFVLKSEVSEIQPS